MHGAIYVNINETMVDFSKVTIWLRLGSKWFTAL